MAKLKVKVFDLDPDVERARGTMDTWAKVLRGVAAELEERVTLPDNMRLNIVGVGVAELEVELF